MADCVYLIEAVGYGFYKIGRAQDITARFNALSQAYRPIELRLLHVIDCQNAGMFPIERRLHQWFKQKGVQWVDRKHRNQCEWFVLTEDDIAWFKRLNDTNWEQMTPGVSHIVPHGI